MQNYHPLYVPICIASHHIIYSESISTVVFNPVIDGKESHPVEFTHILHVLQLRNNLLAYLYLTKRKHFKMLVEDTTMHFKCDGMTLFTAKFTNENAVILNGVTEVISKHAHTASTLPFNLNLWHHYFSHHSYADVKKMIREDWSLV
ncbi:hypothetical protein BDN70DRAFT_807769 [Pholiota conissans]|uniref:Uncharacterized protein n=1 Tax=Pholiota conissans TaxID=109636 RepID=A0A9P6CT38_9AGAR|nr:hypothetical protein BDN70DRAFT_807769 [Pholiota conissans]